MTETRKTQKEIWSMRALVKYLDERLQVAEEEGDPLKSLVTKGLPRQTATDARREAIKELIRDHEKETDKLVETLEGHYRSYRECCGQGDGSVKDLIEAINHQKVLVRQLESALTTAKEKLSEVKDLASEVKATGIKSYLKNGE